MRRIQNNKPTGVWTPPVNRFLGQLLSQHFFEKKQKMAVDLGWVVGVNSTLTSTISYRGILERGLLPLFYLVPPSKSSFETLEEVPTYVNDVRN